MKITHSKVWAHSHHRRHAVDIRVDEERRDKKPHVIRGSRKISHSLGTSSHGGCPGGWGRPLS